MSEVDDRFKKLVNEPYTLFCQECKGDMLFKGSGRYCCSQCGWEYVTNFGKVKRYIEEHGPSTMATIIDETKVSQKEINQYLKDGRIEEVDIKR